MDKWRFGRLVVVFSITGHDFNHFKFSCKERGRRPRWSLICPSKPG